MGERLHPLAAFLPLGLLVAVMICSGPACIPPPISPGYVSVQPDTKNKAVIQLMGCGAFETAGEAGYGAGALLFDPFVTERLSLPFGVSGGGGNATGAAAARLGIRYRTASMLSLGGGIGGGVGGSSFSSAGSMFLDLELALGGRWSIVGLSVSLRPTFEVVHGFFFSPVSIALALYPRPRWAITFYVLGSPWMDMMDVRDQHGGWIGGGLGFVIHV